MVGVTEQRSGRVGTAGRAIRVLHVIPGVAARYGGPSGAVFDMCRAVERAGGECVIATTDADGPGRLAVDVGRPVRYREAHVVFFRRQWSEAFKYSGGLARWLDANVGRFDLAHLHAVFSHSSLAAARACRRRRVPYVVRPLGALAPWSMGQKWARKWIAWHVGVKQMLRGAAAIHYTTAAERREAEERLGVRRGVVVPLGVDIATADAFGAAPAFRRRYAAIAGAPYVLTLCRLHPKKGLELLIDAFLEVTAAAEFAGWKLVIAGDGDAAYVTALRERIAARGGGARVVFTGWLDGVEKRGALGGAALCALLSRQENFGLAAAEALACGVPVLVSSEVNLAEDIRDAGAGWVVPLAPGQIAGVLAEALRDEDQRRARGAAGRGFARQRLDPAVVGARLIDCYRAIVHGASLPGA